MLFHAAAVILAMNIKARARCKSSRQAGSLAHSQTMTVAVGGRKYDGMTAASTHFGLVL